MALACDLQQLVDLLHYRVLLGFDEGILGRLAQCSTSLRDVAYEPALWRRLAAQADQQAAARYLGVLSPEAVEVVSAESDPPPRHNRTAGSGSGGSAFNWRDVCRQLRPVTAVRPWDKSGRAIRGPVWEELTDGYHGGTVGEPTLPARGLFAAQSPHVFWVGGDQLLALAGVYFSEVLGGANSLLLSEVYLLDLSASNDVPPGPVATAPDDAPGARRPPRQALEEDDSDASSDEERPQLVPTPCRVRAGRLDCGTADGALLRGHPDLNGAASDFCPTRSVAYIFGGGSPHGVVCSCTSALRLSDWGGVSGTRPPTARWEVVETPGSVEAGQRPSARQGLRGVVFRDEFVIFGGRELGGECRDDVWSLDLGPADGSIAPRRWRPLMCEGRGPSARVWYGACHALNGSWFVYGGSTWQFEEPAQPHDYQMMFILDIASRQWTSVDPTPAPAAGLASDPPEDPPPVAPARDPVAEPPIVVSPALVPLGGCQVLLLGGCMPHQIGPENLSAGNLMRWRNWYRRLDQPCLFDLATGTWSEESASVIDPRATADEGRRPSPNEDYITEQLLRSHLSATFVPTRRSVVVFGGSRYFTGEYFHDVLELHLPVISDASCRTSVFGCGRAPIGAPAPLREFTAPDALPRFLRRIRVPGEPPALTRGLLGRLRAMARDGLLPEDEFQRILQEF